MDTHMTPYRLILVPIALLLFTGGALGDTPNTAIERALESRGSIRKVQEQRLGAIGILTITRVSVSVADSAPVAGVRIATREFARFVDDAEVPTLARALRTIGGATILENEQIAYRSIDGVDFSLSRDSTGAVRLFISARGAPSVMLDQADAGRIARMFTSD